MTGTDDPDDGSTVLVQASSPGTPRLWFQFVSESKVVKNRVHLDLTCADVDAEVEGLARLGAHVLAERESLVTMADPEGNEFDVMQGVAVGTALIRTTGSASGRLGTWWPPAGEHWTAQDFESFRKSVPLPVTRES